VASRRFPPPWSVEDIGAAYVVTDSGGQKLVYVYYEEEPGQAISGQAAHQGRGSAHRGQCGEAAGPRRRHKREAPSNTPLGAAEFLPHLRLLSRAAGVSGEGCRSVRPSTAV
jgi:hypothetical protein